MVKSVLPERPRLTAILDKYRHELMSVVPDRFVSINAVRDRILELTDIVLEGIRPYESVFERELSAARAREYRERIARLHERAQTYFAADLFAEELFSDDQVAERRRLFERVAQHDQTLLKWAWPLFGDDPARAAILADIQSGTGYKDSAEDVVRLVRFYRANWAEAEGKTPIVEEYLDEAEADATAMLDQLNNRGASSEARDLARRAFVLWHDDYQALMFLGRYLGSGEPDVTVRFPGVHSVKSRSGGADDDSIGADSSDEPGPGGDAASDTDV